MRTVTKSRLSWALVAIVGMPWFASAGEKDKDRHVGIEEPFLWTIEGPRTQSFIFGTIHFPDQRLIRFPMVLDRALTVSDAIYTEVPMDFGTLAQVSVRGLRQDGRSFKDVAPPALHARCAKYLERKGLQLEALGQFKTWVIMSQIATAEFAQQAATQPVLDSAIYNRGVKDGKIVGGLETIDEQISILESFNEQQQLEMLADGLEQLEAAEKKGERPLPIQLLEAYLEGDDDDLEEFLLRFMDLEKPLQKEFYDKVLLKRNRIMAERIEKMIRTHPDRRHFFAIGAGHAVGKQSVIELLDDRGYKLKRLDLDESDKIR